jgi:hypothetical protein
MKQTKKLLAVLLSVAMLFSLAALTACDGDNGPGDGTTPQPTEGGDTTTTEPDSGEGNGPGNLPESIEFDFGIVAFNSRDFVVPEGRGTTNVEIGRAHV